MHLNVSVIGTNLIHIDLFYIMLDLYLFLSYNININTDENYRSHYV